MNIVQRIVSQLLRRNQGGEQVIMDSVKSLVEMSAAEQERRVKAVETKLMQHPDMIRLYEALLAYKAELRKTSAMMTRLTKSVDEMRPRSLDFGTNGRANWPKGV
jgi:hypothetical protein